MNKLLTNLQLRFYKNCFIFFVSANIYRKNVQKLKKIFKNVKFGSNITMHICKKLMVTNYDNKKRT